MSVTAKNMDLTAGSIDLIRAHQHPGGAYVACPGFPAYRYSWLRDGSFIAWSMILHGELQSAGKFLRWVDGTVNAGRECIERLRGREEDIGDGTGKGLYLPARYNLDGSVHADDWPNHQIDGYGAWLWCLAEFLSVAGAASIPEDFLESVRLTVRYLERVWDRPCYDCWEENGEKIHPSTLACVYGGLHSINRFLSDPRIDILAASVKSLILSGTVEGRFPKFLGSGNVDASLLWLCLPFRVVEPDDPLMVRTVGLIEEKLLKDGGVQRYPEDTYYGGGQWILLSCWLGWYYFETGRFPEAEALLRWVEEQADENGEFPEQVQTVTNDPSCIGIWEARWGKAAKPLLWSHAMYLVLKRAIVRMHEPTHVPQENNR